MEILNTKEEKEEFKMKENCKIFNYLKEQPAVLISLISGFVITITFILNCVIYAKEYRILQFWGIDAKYVQIDNLNQIYIFAVISIVFLISIVFQQIMFATYEIYLENTKDVLKNEVIDRALRKDVLRKKFRIRFPKQKLEEDDKIYLKKAKEVIESNKSLRKEITKAFSKKVLSTSGIIGILSILVYTNLFAIVVPNINWAYSIIGGGLLSFVFVVVMPVITYYIARREKKKEINIKDIIQNRINGKVDEPSNIENHEYIIDKLFDLKLREIFNDKGILHSFIVVMVWILMLFGVLYFTDIDGNSSQTRLSITRQEDKIYAIVYTNTEFYYLEEVEINCDKIKVYLNNQKLISKDGVEYQVYIFENKNIHRIDDENEIKEESLSGNSNGIQ